ncbi:MAG: transcription antitermination factor NusB [Acidimicrobiia bacterium]|nr:transcription antitermination factor NusB [Acidimicrobiia bacterium]
MSIEPRDRALRALYEIDLRKLDGPGDELSGKAKRLVEGVLGRLPELDRSLEATANRWRVERMPPVDRAILRLGLYELRHEPATPVAVVLSEAVRLAKTYSTEKSGAFVNGVLGVLAESARDREV